MIGRRLTDADLQRRKDTYKTLLDAAHLPDQWEVIADEHRPDGSRWITFRRTSGQVFGRLHLQVFVDRRGRVTGGSWWRLRASGKVSRPTDIIGRDRRGQVVAILEDGGVSAAEGVQ